MLPAMRIVYGAGAAAGLTRAACGDGATRAAAADDSGGPSADVGLPTPDSTVPTADDAAISDGGSAGPTVTCSAPTALAAANLRYVGDLGRDFVTHQASNPRATSINKGR